MAVKISFADATQLKSFLVEPATGTTELRVTDTTRNTRGMLESLGHEILEDSLFNVVARRDSSPDIVSYIEVAWVGPGDQISKLALPPTPESHRDVVLGARLAGVGVRYFSHDDNRIPRNMPAGALFAARQPVEMGKLQSTARLVETPQLLDVSISQISKPGLVGRKIRRRQPVHTYFQVYQDTNLTRVAHQRRSGLDAFEVRNDQLLGIASSGHKPFAVTTDGVRELPEMSYWSSVDFRGRDFASWAYDRLLVRLGM